MQEANPKHENMINFGEYKKMVAHKPLMIAQLTINISKYDSLSLSLSLSLALSLALSLSLSLLSSIFFYF
jgi:hypothetical protein